MHPTRERTVAARPNARITDKTTDFPNSVPRAAVYITRRIIPRPNRRIFAKMNVQRAIGLGCDPMRIKYTKEYLERKDTDIQTWTCHPFVFSPITFFPEYTPSSLSTFENLFLIPKELLPLHDLSLHAFYL